MTSTRAESLIKCRTTLGNMSVLEIRRQIAFLAWSGVDHWSFIEKWYCDKVDGREFFLLMRSACYTRNALHTFLLRQFRPHLGFYFPWNFVFAPDLWACVSPSAPPHPGLLSSCVRVMTAAVVGGTLGRAVNQQPSGRRALHATAAE